MERDLTKGSPLRLIVTFALPVLLGGILQQMYSLADILIVGRTISSDALAAVGLSAPVTYLMQAIAWGLPNGFALFTAQRFGARDSEGVKKSIATSLWFGLLLSAVLTLVTVLPLNAILYAINTPTELFAMAKEYLFITACGYIATVFYNLIAQILRSLGDSRTPLYFLIGTCLLNIGLDFALIVGLRMGVGGAALATVISQMLAAVLCFIYAHARFDAFKLKAIHFKTNWNFLWSHLRIGLPMSFQFAITSLGSIFVQSVVNTFSPVIIAAVAAVMKIEQFVAQSTLAIGSATATYTAQNFGSGNLDRVKKGVRASILIQLVLSVVAAILMTTAGTPLAKLFVTDLTAAEMLELEWYARRYLYIHAAFYVFLGLLPTYRNALQGVGKSFGAFCAGVADVAMRAAAAFGLVKVMGYDGICLAEPLAWLLSVVVQVIIYYILMFKVFPKDGGDRDAPLKEQQEQTKDPLQLIEHQMQETATVPFVTCGAIGTEEVKGGLE